MSEPADRTPQNETLGQRLAAEGRALVTALQFMTLVPPIIKRLFTPRELGSAVAYFPAVGLLIGGLLALIDLAAGAIFSPAITAVLVLIAWIGITGALHLDGFLDSCDGLLGGYTPEKRLEIMRDHRVGAYGLAGGVLMLLLYHSALVSMPDRAAALLVAPLVARWVISLTVVTRPYARPEGMGKTMADRAGRAQLLIASAVTIVGAVLIGGIAGLWALAIGLLVFWLGTAYVLKKIPGVTGDIYGALCVITEALVLVGFTLR